MSSLIFPDIFRRVLVTGGAGFIGGALVRRLLLHTDVKIFNLDKFGYASDLTNIQLAESALGEKSKDRHHFLKTDLFNKEATKEAIRLSDPDLVFHLAAESHVDRSIAGPSHFIDSNVTGTLNLLEAVRWHWEGLDFNRQSHFRFHHISTDEVFGSLGDVGAFNEETAYDPRSPYSASKAASDHLVRAWHHTYALPITLSNCSNNYGPWQFPEKLIPLVILKALANEPIPIYGDGKNVRDWLYVDDHIDALLLASTRGKLGRSYCIGGHGESSNLAVVEKICSCLDDIFPEKPPHSNLIEYVTDRPGHDHRYSIDSSRITSELGWKPRHDFDEGLSATVNWYLDNQEWCSRVLKSSGYDSTRIGLESKSNN